MSAGKPGKRVTPEETSEEEVKCGLCKEYLKEPKLLSCLHCFCRHCLEGKAAEYIPTQTLKCPTCDQDTNIANNDLTYLPTLHYLENLQITAHKMKKRAVPCDKCVDKPAVARKFCRQCGFVCEQCEQVHKTFKGLEDHEIVDFETLQSDFRRYGKLTTEQQKCSNHNKKFKYYCFTCEHLVCRDCFTIGEHKEHHYENVSESNKTRFQTLESSLGVIQSICHKRVKEGIENVEGVKTNIEDQVQKAGKKIEVAIEQAHRVLDERKEELLEDVASRAKEKQDALDEQLKKLTAFSCEIERIIRTVNGCLHSENNADIASAHKFMGEKMQRIIHECESVELTPVAVANIKTKLGLPEAIRRCSSVEESSADPTKCSVSLDNVNAAVGEEASVVVRTVYENDQPCLESQEVRVELHQSIEGGRDEKENVIQATISGTTKRGEYECKFVPTTRGWHALKVMVNGQNIKGSPFKLYVVMPPSQLKHVHRTLDLPLPYQVVFTSEGHMIITCSSKPAQIMLVTEKSRTEFCKDNSHSAYHPTGIAMSKKEGSVFIAYDKPCIVKYDQSGHKLRETQQTHAAEHTFELKRPGRIELTKDESELYVCDRGNERIAIFNTDLNFVRVFPLQGLISGVAFGGSDRETLVFLSDKNKNIIYKCRINGDVIAMLGGSMLKAPRGLLIKDGYLYVSDRNNGRIVAFEGTGSHQLVATFGQIHDCGSLIADSNGYLYVCSERENQIYVF